MFLMHAELVLWTDFIVQLVLLVALLLLGSRGLPKGLKSFFWKLEDPMQKETCV